MFDKEMIERVARRSIQDYSRENNGVSGFSREGVERNVILLGGDKNDINLVMAEAMNIHFGLRGKMLQ